MWAMLSTALWKAGSLLFEGLLKPLIFLTNWSEAARIYSLVTGGSKLKSVLIFRHIPTVLRLTLYLWIQARFSSGGWPPAYITPLPAISPFLN